MHRWKVATSRNQTEDRDVKEARTTILGAIGHVLCPSQQQGASSVTRGAEGASHSRGRRGMEKWRDAGGREQPPACGGRGAETEIAPQSVVVKWGRVCFPRFKVSQGLPPRIPLCNVTSPLSSQEVETFLRACECGWLAAASANRTKMHSSIWEGSRHVGEETVQKLWKTTWRAEEHETSKSGGRGKEK